MRIIVVIGLLADDRAGLFEVADDILVGVEDIHAGIGRCLGGEIAGEVDRVDAGDAGGGGDVHIVLAEGRGDVHNTGAFTEFDELAAEDDKGAGGVGKEREHRSISSPDQVGTLERSDVGGVGKLLGVVLARCIGEDPMLSVPLEHRVIGVGMDGESEVRRQRPGRRRPG